MIGYCCIALGPNIGKSKKNQISVNRGMIRSTFNSKGLDYVTELSIKNIDDCMCVLEYNISNDIRVYRLSSDIFPCLGFYNLENLPRWDLLKSKLENIGSYIINNGIRVGFHPSHFCVLASENQSVVSNTIDELDKHSLILDYMGLPSNDYYPINIHISTTKPTLEKAADRFVLNFEKLSTSCKNRLTVENDDSINQYSVKMLYDLVYSRIGTPIVFDQHHFNYGPKDQCMEDAIKMARSTWKTKQLTHMSSSRKIEDKNSRSTAHADYIYEKIETFGMDFDTEIEAKAKDLAVIKYRKEFEI